MSSPNRNPGGSYPCGNVPTDGQDHQPIDGPHIATILGPEGKFQPPHWRVICTCGHRWLIPATENQP